MAEGQGQGQGHAVDQHELQAFRFGFDSEAASIITLSPLAREPSIITTATTTAGDHAEASTQWHPVSPPRVITSQILQKASESSTRTEVERYPGRTDDGVQLVVPCPSDIPEFKAGWRLYLIMVGLALTNLLAALENTVVSIAAPVILTELGISEDFIWITNAFFLCSTAMQPLLGQLVNSFGRRPILLTSIFLFTLGSLLCGLSRTSTHLIAGRSIQGAGSGGIMACSSIIISDLVPLRQRGPYSAVIMMTAGLGAALGPFIGGAIVSTTTWRWVFWINLPVGGTAWLWLWVFLRVRHNRERGVWERLWAIDYTGNALVAASSTSILYALSYAGLRYPWGSWHTLVPLLLGFAGLVLFGWRQTIVAEPLMPKRFFAHPTSILLCVATFLASALLYWFVFFLPVYFQGVRLYSPERSGVAMLPISLLGIPGAILGALGLTRWGKYKVLHSVAFAVQTIGAGLFAFLYEYTPVVQWVSFQCVAALGGGLLFTTLLPAFQAFVEEKDLAAATSAWYFIRMFGQIWGVAIPAAVFNNRIGTLIEEGAVSNPFAAAVINKGGAYAAASADFVTQFDIGTQVEIKGVYMEALQMVFIIAVVFSGVGFLLSFGESEIPLRTTLVTEFSLEKGREKRVRRDEFGFV